MTEPGLADSPIIIIIIIIIIPIIMDVDTPPTPTPTANFHPDPAMAINASLDILRQILFFDYATKEQRMMMMMMPPPPSAVNSRCKAKADPDSWTGSSGWPVRGKEIRPLRATLARQSQYCPSVAVAGVARGYVYR